MTILQDLFYGNIHLNAGGFDRDPEYGKAMQAVAENEKKLLALLNDAEKELLIVFSDAQFRLNSITAGLSRALTSARLL